MRWVSSSAPNSVLCLQTRHPRSNIHYIAHIDLCAAAINRANSPSRWTSESGHEFATRALANVVTPRRNAHRPIINCKRTRQSGSSLRPVYARNPRPACDANPFDAVCRNRTTVWCPAPMQGRDNHDHRRSCCHWCAGIVFERPSMPIAPHSASAVHQHRARYLYGATSRPLWPARLHHRCR